MLLFKEKVTKMGNSSVIKVDKKFMDKELIVMDEETLELIKNK